MTAPRRLQLLLSEEIGCVDLSISGRENERAFLCRIIHPSFEFMFNRSDVQSRVYLLSTQLKPHLAVESRINLAWQLDLITKSRESEIVNARGASIDIHIGLKSECNLRGLNRQRLMGAETGVVFNGRRRPIAVSIVKSTALAVSKYCIRCAKNHNSRILPELPL
jgi:hypothetical protein